MALVDVRLSIGASPNTQETKTKVSKVSEKWFRD